ncbi:unnamed protein product, partial [Iphiclides podalirius]
MVLVQNAILKHGLVGERRSAPPPVQRPAWVSGCVWWADASLAYVLFAQAVCAFQLLVPVLARRPYGLFGASGSVPLTALHEECIAPSVITRSTSSPVRGAEWVLSWPTLKGSRNSGHPVGRDIVLWCFISRPGASPDLSISGLFGAWFTAAKDNEMRHVRTQRHARAVLRSGRWCLCLCAHRYEAVFAGKSTLHAFT